MEREGPTITSQAEIIHITIMLSLNVLCEKLHKQYISVLLSGLPIATVYSGHFPHTRAKHGPLTQQWLMSTEPVTHTTVVQLNFRYNKYKSSYWPPNSTSSIHLTFPQFISQDPSQYLSSFHSLPQIQKSFRAKILHALSPYVLKYPAFVF